MGVGRQALLIWTAAWLWLPTRPVSAQASAPPASARASALEVRFRGPDGCPSSEWVRAEIGRLLGRDAAALESTAARVDGSVRSTSEGRFELTLRTDVNGQPGQRTIDGESCQALAAATALIAALAIDPEAAEAARAAQQSPAASGVTGSGAAATTASAADDPEDEHDSDSENDAEDDANDPSEAQDEDADSGDDEPSAPLDIGWQAAASAGLDVGSLPAPAFGVVLEAALTLDALELWLSGRLYPSNGLALGAVPGEAAELSLASAGVSACYLLSRPVELAPCVGAQFGSMWGEGGSAVAASTGGAPWIALDAGIRVRVFVLPWLALQGVAGVALPVLRPVFTIAGLGVVHEVSPVAGRFELGLLIRP